MTKLQSPWMIPNTKLFYIQLTRTKYNENTIHRTFLILVNDLWFTLPIHVWKFLLLEPSLKALLLHFSRECNLQPFYYEKRNASVVIMICMDKWFAAACGSIGIYWECTRTSNHFFCFVSTQNFLIAYPVFVTTSQNSFSIIKHLFIGRPQQSSITSVAIDNLVRKIGHF